MLLLLASCQISLFCVRNLAGTFSLLDPYELEIMYFFLLARIWWEVFWQASLLTVQMNFGFTSILFRPWMEYPAFVKISFHGGIFDFLLVLTSLITSDGPVSYLWIFFQLQLFEKLSADPAPTRCRWSVPLSLDWHFGI